MQPDAIPKVGENGVFQPRFGGTDESVVSPIGLGFLVLAGILFLVLPRKYRFIPLFCVCYFITAGQTLVIAGLHFQMLRLIILFGWLRIGFSYLEARHEVARFRMNVMDRAFIVWVISSCITFTILWGSFSAFLNKCGFAYGILGTYFLLRYLVQDDEDVDRMIRVFAWVAAIIAACMLREQMTGQNLFSVFGGVPLYTVIREGKLRSQAAFGNAILAGTFGSSLLPLFVLLWQSTKYKISSLVGIAASFVIGLTSHSSTPFMVFGAGIIGLCAWPLRKFMRTIRWGIVALILGLQLVMKAPVWSLIARADMVGGSSGYHRYVLVDAFIRHFFDWWLVGFRYPETWGWFTGDLANEFILQGVFGGLITFVLFLRIIVLAFRRLKRGRDLTPNIRQQKRLWALGCTVFATCAAFFGIDYFDQSIVTWYSLLAMIVAATTVAAAAPSLAKSAKTKSAKERKAENVIDDLARDEVLVNPPIETPSEVTAPVSHWTGLGLRKA